MVTDQFGASFSQDTILMLMVFCTASAAQVGAVQLDATQVGVVQMSAP